MICCIETEPRQANKEGVVHRYASLLDFLWFAHCRRRHDKWCGYDEIQQRVHEIQWRPTCSTSGPQSRPALGHSDSYPSFQLFEQSILVGTPSTASFADQPPEGWLKPPSLSCCTVFCTSLQEEDHCHLTLWATMRNTIGKQYLWLVFLDSLEHAASIEALHWQ